MLVCRLQRDRLAVKCQARQPGMREALGGLCTRRPSDWPLRGAGFPWKESGVKRSLVVAAGCLLVFGVSACVPAKVAIPNEPTSTPWVTGDTFFTGCTYLDANRNGKLDLDDTLLGGMSFIVTLADGSVYTSATSEEHCAFITVPTALPPEAWPAEARLNLPHDAPYQFISEPRVLLEHPHSRAVFLFKTP